MRGKSAPRPQIRPFQSIHNDQRQRKDDINDLDERFKRFRAEARRKAEDEWTQKRNKEEARQRQQLDVRDFLEPNQNHEPVDMDHSVYPAKDARAFTERLFHRMATDQPLDIPSDVVIVVRGLRFPAHRMLLCAHSELWRSMLYPKRPQSDTVDIAGRLLFEEGAAAAGGVTPRGLNETQRDNGDNFVDPPPREVELSLAGLACERDPTLRVWETVLRFCYTGALKVQQSNVHKIWEFCVHFKLKSLAKAIEEEIHAVLLDPSNVFPVFKLALRHQKVAGRKLADHCQAYFHRSCREILHSNAFLGVSFEDLSCALSTPKEFDFRIPEFELFEALIRWHQHQIRSKRPPPKPARRHARKPSRKMKHRREISIQREAARRLEEEARQVHRLSIIGDNVPEVNVPVHRAQPRQLVSSHHDSFRLVSPDDDDDEDESVEEDEFSSDDGDTSSSDATDPFASDNDADQSASVHSDDDGEDPFAASEGDDEAEEQERLRSLVDHLKFHTMTADEIERVMAVVAQNPEFGLQYLIDDQSLGREPAVPHSALMSKRFAGAISKLFVSDKCAGVGFELLYSNADHARHEATISAFHAKCDGRGPTVCLIRAKPSKVKLPKDERKEEECKWLPSREIFGGFNPVDWGSARLRAKSRGRKSKRSIGAISSAFLFSLVGPRSRGCDEPANNRKLVPRKYSMRPDLDNAEHAEPVRAPNLGPSFGVGDLRVSNEHFTNEDSWSDLKHYRCEKQQAVLDQQKQEALTRDMSEDEFTKLDASIFSEPIFSIDILEVFSVTPKHKRSRSLNPFDGLRRDKPR